jgi:signal transduction histidine kinase
VQALLNLLSNAVKYGGGGAMVEVGVDRRPDDRVAMWVRDRGPGIPADLRARVFDKYVRSAHGQGGTFGKGLGLAFCRIAVEAHRGRVWVEDNAPNGSVFVVSIPLPPAPGA